jgi:hypothetical protein
MHDIGDIIRVNDTMQIGYSYKLNTSMGDDYDDGFKPCFTPQEMLEMGVFEGKYLNDCTGEFPKEWFQDAKLSNTADPQLNYFNIKSRQPLSVWKKNGWIIPPDPRGWFQWYCRYYMGRRILLVDQVQIKRWKAFARHQVQVKKNCTPREEKCRPRQRQALLQWSHDCFV